MEPHPMLAPLSWLLGKWETVEPTRGFYPTISDFRYHEEAEFSHVGQPNIQFSLYARNAESNKPMHREIGFIRIKPGSDSVAWVGAQNTGLSDVEEGSVSGQSLTVTSTGVNRLSWGKEPAVKTIQRTFRREGDFLFQTLSMETATQPLQAHLEVKYRLVK